MDQLKDFADDRLISGCIYCGNPPQTRDHIPSRIFLDSPYPDNLPVIGCCLECNNGFSLDEEFVACLIESIISGSADPEKIRRESIRNILAKKPSLRTKIEMAFVAGEGDAVQKEGVSRIKNVLLKLARGHMAYEASQLVREEPKSFWWSPLDQMEESHRESFNSFRVVRLFGEVGSRAFQRYFFAQLTPLTAEGDAKPANMVLQGWVYVQEGRYRYMAIDDINEKKVRIVVSEYLACEFIWEDGDESAAEQMDSRTDVVNEPSTDL